MLLLFKMNSVIKLILSIAAPLLIGFIGSQYTIAEIPGWYAGLQKPTWNPPNWLFGPVWTLLYILMGIAAYLVWKTLPQSAFKKWGLFLYALQLVLNLLWTYLFFSKHQLGAALIEIVVLWLTIFCTIIAFSKVNKTAAWLLVPYISWVSFATMLNYTIWQLNP